MTTEVYTTQEVCAILRCNRTTVYELAKAGYIRQILRGRFTIASVRALLDGGVPCPDVKRADPKAKAPTGTMKKPDNTDGAIKVKPSQIPIPSVRKRSFES